MLFVVDKLIRLIPPHLFHGVDTILVGEFDLFHKNNTNAVYEDGAIYVSNLQSNNEDMVDDIVHELAHSVEEVAFDEIYGDNLVEREFLGKRKRLLDILSQEGYTIYNNNFMNPNYSQEFDEFLYQDIGYPALQGLTMGLFASPYAATSLREYFADGFEEYFLRDRGYLKKISPFLFDKLENITEIGM